MSLWKLIVGRFGDGAGETDEVRIDAATNSLQVVDYEHHEIHAGSHFFHIDETSLNSGNTIDIALKTANTTKWTHLTWNIESQGQLSFNLYEGSWIDWDGTELTAYNNNRNNGATSNWQQFQSNPTVGTLGTELMDITIGSATNPNIGLPGANTRNREIVLKQNENYLLRLTSGMNSNIVTYALEWYEHTDKN